jgi:hypothetical protein
VAASVAQAVPLSTHSSPSVAVRPNAPSAPSLLAPPVQGISTASYDDAFRPWLIEVPLHLYAFFSFLKNNQPVNNNL